MTAYRSFSARAEIEAILAARGTERADVAALQPADAFLDTAGEELRRRIYLTQGQDGTMMCLRPEFTIPVCLKHVAEARDASRYSYVGTVFQQGQGGPSEFLQAGIEDIGDLEYAASDARSLADCLSSVSSIGYTRETEVLMGDQAVFDAVLSALGLPSGWRVRLTQAFGDDAALENALVRLAQPPSLPPLPEPILAAADAGNESAVETLVADAMEEASLTASGGRTAAAITSRLMARVRQTKQVPAADKLDTLRAFLRINVPLDLAVERLAEFTENAGLNLDGTLEAFEARSAALDAADIDLASITYSASFGRTLDYYTGLVYEVRNASGDVLAGGGRYDRLLALLGADEPTPGVGFSLWLDRLMGDQP